MANYACIIAFRRDNWNVDMCPDPSSFPAKVLVLRLVRQISSVKRDVKPLEMVPLQGRI